MTETHVVNERIYVSFGYLFFRAPGPDVWVRTSVQTNAIRICK